MKIDHTNCGKFFINCKNKQFPFATISVKANQYKPRGYNVNDTENKR